MTVCVALESGGGVILGTDSFIGDSFSKDSLDGPKVFRKGALAIAYAGNLRIPQIIAHTLTVPRFTESKAALWTVSLSEQIRQILQEHGALGRDEESGHTLDSEMLLAIRGKVYTLQTDFAVYRVARGFAAIGAGAPYALGSLFTSQGLDPTERVGHALKAAGQFSTQVLEPFWCVEV